MKRRYFDNGWAIPLLVANIIAFVCKKVMQTKLATAAAVKVPVIGKVPIIGGLINKAVSTTASAATVVTNPILNMVGNMSKILLIINAILIVIWLLTLLTRRKPKPVESVEASDDTNRMDSF